MQQKELRIETTPLTSKATLVRLTGNLDAHTYEWLEKALDGLYSRGSYGLVVDMTDLDYMASAGIGVLITALSRTRENRGDILLLNPRPAVTSVLELLGLRELFQVVSDRASAVNMLARASLAKSA